MKGPLELWVFKATDVLGKTICIFGNILLETDVNSGHLISLFNRFGKRESIKEVANAINEYLQIPDILLDDEEESWIKVIRFKHPYDIEFHEDETPILYSSFSQEEIIEFWKHFSEPYKDSCAIAH